ncbi:MAG: hypothetical protein ABEJ31_09775 [Haloarculaceae archaeon]
MPWNTWLHGVVFALAFVQLVMFWVLYRRSQPSGVTNGSDAPASRRHRRRDDAEATPVTCIDCGTRNEPLYRFCRNCASKLPRPRQSR